MVLLILLACFITSVISTNSTKDVIAEINRAANTTKEILKASKTSDPAKVEIVKQIRRLNEDGSYTIGYEADDGTFKIESRDVMGNVKGTFGYVDKDGEIKRVTYTSSSDSTPVPVTTSTTPSTPVMVVRINKTVSSTTRRPLATVVYPTRSTSTTRGPVVQSIPRRRTPVTTRPPPILVENTTERQNSEASSSNILHLYKPKAEDSGSKLRTQLLNPVSAGDDLVSKQTTTPPSETFKPVYENVDEKGPEINSNKGNTIRRELIGTSPNPRMVNLQQSAGDDSTDVYGNHLSLGTLPPLFTTTTPRPRLVPIQSIVAARQKIQQVQQQQILPIDQETTIEASTGRVFDRQNVVTSNPVPIIHIPQQSDEADRIYHQRPIYKKQPSTIHFRTEEYIKDNPGAPIPIGNQRPFLHYEYQNKILEPQFLKESSSSLHSRGHPEQATESSHYEIRPITRIIPVPVDERGIPLQGYQGRLVTAYRPTPPPVFQSRYEPIIEEMNSISAPVSTRDLKRLLQILILRQNRLQSLMDQIVAPGPPYQPMPLFRQEQPQYDYNRYQSPHQYEEDSQYDYRYDQQLRQSEIYRNHIPRYERPQTQYESQRYVPRRSLYTRPTYDTASSSSDRIEESQDEYLPAEIREALLLKMLMLAISPDFMPTPAPATEMTTAAPTRKQVRNVQILGEEGATDNMKRVTHRH